MLAACKEGASKSSTSPPNESPSISITGVGIDLDEVSLNLARINSIAAASDFCDGTQAIKSDFAITPPEYPCEWVKADFTLLHTEAVRSRLVDAVCLIDTAVGRSEEEGLFDVIICNPPFLSEKSTRGNDPYRIAISLLQLPYLIFPNYLNLFYR